MRRREFVRTGAIIATAGATGLAGCSRPEEETGPEESDQAFEYFFEDKTGTLGSAATDDIPEDASEEQIITNTRTEDEWREMQLNDYNFAELAFDDQIAPFVDLNEGSVQAIADRTREIYNQKTADISGDDAEIYTSSVLRAVDEVTDAGDGPTYSYLVPTLSEWILDEHMDAEIPNYRWHHTRSKIGKIGEGFSHPLGILHYGEEGETQVRYAEVEPRLTAMIVRPENSIYHASLDQDSFTGAGDQPLDPSDYVTPFDYTKMREMGQRGLLDADPENTEVLIFHGFLSYIDDAGMTGWDFEQLKKEGRIENAGVEANNTKGHEWIKGVTSDSYGESTEQYLVSPDEDYTRRDFEVSARAIFSALEQQDFAGPVGLDGELGNPRVIHATEQKVQALRENRNYDEIASNILS